MSVDILAVLAAAPPFAFAAVVVVVSTPLHVVPLTWSRTEAELTWGRAHTDLTWQRTSVELHWND